MIKGKCTEEFQLSMDWKAGSRKACAGLAIPVFLHSVTMPSIALLGVL